MLSGFELYPRWVPLIRSLSSEDSDGYENVT